VHGTLERMRAHRPGAEALGASGLTGVAFNLVTLVIVAADGLALLTLLLRTADRDGGRDH